MGSRNDEVLERNDQIRAIAETGQSTTRQLAAKYGLSINHIRRILSGRQSSTTHHRIRPRTTNAKHLAGQAALMYRLGASHRDIMLGLDISYGYVNRLLSSEVDDNATIKVELTEEVVSKGPDILSEGRYEVRLLGERVLLTNLDNDKSYTVDVNVMKGCWRIA